MPASVSIAPDINVRALPTNSAFIKGLKTLCHTLPTFGDEMSAVLEQFLDGGRTRDDVLVSVFNRSPDGSNACFADVKSKEAVARLLTASRAGTFQMRGRVLTVEPSRRQVHASGHQVVKQDWHRTTSTGGSTGAREAESFWYHS